jgi:hypothetical protein
MRTCENIGHCYHQRRLLCQQVRLVGYLSHLVELFNCPYRVHLRIAILATIITKVEDVETRKFVSDALMTKLIKFVWTFDLLTFLVIVIQFWSIHQLDLTELDFTSWQSTWSSSCQVYHYYKPVTLALGTGSLFTVMKGRRPVSCVIQLNVQHCYMYTLVLTIYPIPIKLYILTAKVLVDAP